MQRRTATTIQRLALCAGLAAGAWLAAEGLDHGTAWADDVPVRVEQQTDSERPGGVLDLVGDVIDPVDEILDEVLPGRGGGDDPGRGGDSDDEPADDEPDTPIRDIVEEVVDAITPETPEPAEGDSGRPQHPVDTPPAPDTTPETPTGGEPAEAPAGGEPAEAPAGETPTTSPAPSTPRELVEPTPQPADWAGPVVPWPAAAAEDMQTDLRQGGPVCISRDDHRSADRGDRPGASTWDRSLNPRGAVGPGVLAPLGAPCQPDDGATTYGQMTATTSSSVDQSGPAAAARSYLLSLDAAADDRTLRDDTALPGRLTLWPPGPG